VANQDDNTVTKLRARDGKALGTFATGVDPEGVVGRKNQRRRGGAARIVIDIGAFWNGLPALRAGPLVCLMASVSPHPPRVI
jgi:hypothetical protein